MSGHGAGHADPANKKVALLISVLALLLAFTQTFAKSAQTAAISYNVEAANLWAFFQAKTIRMTILRTAVEGAEVEMKHEQSAPKREALKVRIDEWKKTAAIYDSEPDKQEGRKELMARAKAAENSRTRSMAAYHCYELGSAAIEIAIVLASAQIITGVVALVWISGGLGVVGFVMSLIGMFAPMALHF